MKMKKITIALLAMAGSALLTTGAKAATYNTGDLLMGFRATTGTGFGTDYVLDLGSPVQFRDATSTFNLSVTYTGRP